MATGLVLALSSQVFQDRFVASEPLAALTVGVLVGPFVGGFVILEELSDEPLALLEQLCRITLSIAILQSALAAGWTWMRRHLRDLLLILLVGLPLMWGLGSLAIAATLGGGALMVALVAATVTPTDPVLAQAVLTSSVAERNVPANVRNLLSVESAANDGLALMLVMLPVLLLTKGAATLPGEIVWLVLWEILGALAVGTLAGNLTGRVLVRVGEQWATRTGVVTVSVTLALAALAGAHLLAMDGLFAVFGAGVGLSAAVGEESEARHAGFSHTLSRLFHLPLMVLLGAALPLDRWWQAGTALLAAVVLVLLIRRLPMVAMLKPGLRTLDRWPSALFAGWFGPIGIAAIFYATYAYSHTGDDSVFVAVSAVVTGSVVAHGLTDTLGSRWLGRSERTRTRPAEGAGEDAASAG